MCAQFANGVLLSPANTTFAHQEAVFSVATLLRAACPPHLRVVLGPFPIRLGVTAELCPDVLVAAYTDLLSDALTGVPLLVVEVVASGSGPVDRTVKKEVYAELGVPSYWIVDPELPALTAHSLGAGGTGYLDVAEVVGLDRYETGTPFPVGLVPVQLVAGVGP